MTLMTEGESVSYPGRVTRVYGPPGTGKTTYLSHYAREVVARNGPDCILISSFSRTAAEEIASRFDGAAAHLRPPARAIGTLHSHALRSIQRPSVALDPEVIADWNRANPGEWVITPDNRSTGGTEGGKFCADPTLAVSGDELLGCLDRFRATLTPEEDWPDNVRRFAKAFTAWKHEAEAVDYCMDDRTEVLTTRGWMDGHNLRTGDLVRSINPETGLAEWQPVESVYRRTGRTTMIHMVNSAHDSMTTPDHRWLINRRDSQENWSRQWVTTQNLNSTARIPRAAVSGDAPSEPKYTDAFVELVAWWFTEGSYRTRGNGGQISQSHRVNPGHCARIEAALRTLLGGPGVRHDARVRWSLSRSDKRGMTFYGLGSSILDELDQAAPDKVPALDFLVQLTPGQLKLFVSTALDADGHVRAQASTFGQRDRRRTEAFVTAALLSGMSATFHERIMNGAPYYEATVSARRLHAVVPGTTGGMATGTRTAVEYEGLIWCPTVARHHNFLARRNGTVYFTGNTDMIEIARDRARDGEGPPGNPSFMIVDEAQDNTPLEHELVRYWGLHVERLVLGLDDDQAINRWRGGDARPLLELSGDDVSDHLLDKSYRVPEAVRAVAQRWVDRLSFRHDKQYQPRTETETRVNADGTTYEHDTGRIVLGRAFLAPESIKDLTLVDRATEEVDRGRTVMIIASCNYMLETLLKNLRDQGIPFHNPYRPSESRWNPLGIITDGMSTAERIFRYMLPSEEMGEHGRLWTGKDVQAWLELVKLKDSGMVGNAKKRASMFDPDAEVSEMDVYALFNDAAQRDRAVEPELNWLAENLLANRKQPAGYPIQVARTYGAAALAERPQIVVGTVHSVKGAAADIVYVCPDISAAAARGLALRDGQDDIIRTFYVAMTRARKELRILAPTTHQHVSRKALLPPGLEVT